LARIALRTDAAVVPGFTIWVRAAEVSGCDSIPAVKLDPDRAPGTDIVANTRQFTKIIEDLCAAVSRTVVMGAPEVEDAAAGEKGLY